MPMAAASIRSSARIQSRPTAERRCTTTGSGYAKRARPSATRAFCACLLEFFADHAIGRIGAAAAQANREHDDAQEKQVLVAAGADAEALDPVSGEHRDQTLDGDGRREEAGGQCDDYVYSCNSV